MVVGPGASPWRLAVDFGTTNTAAAVEHQGQVFPLRLAEGSDAMPSGVLVMSGETKTGTAAARGAAVHLAGFEPTPKRRLAEEHIVLDGGLHPPVELVAAVLRTVYERAMSYANRVEPTEVVLTHPQAWHEHRIGLLRTAAERAGLPVDRLRLLGEPVATAWHYATLDPPQPGSHLAVLDLGGGTCDVALLRFVVEENKGRFEVVDSAGIDPLGGHDFDARLEVWVRDQVRAQGRQEVLTALDDPRSSRARATLRDDVRATKESLSGYQSETVGVIAGEHEWLGTVTRAEYEQLVHADIERAVSLLRMVLDRSLPAGAGLDRLYLTGGSSLTPLLQRRLEELLPGRVGTRGDPKQVTAIGALQVPPEVAPASHLAPTVPDAAGSQKDDRGQQEERSEQNAGDEQEDPDKPRRRVKEYVLGAVTLVLAGIVFLYLALPGGGEADDNPGETTNAGETLPPSQQLLYDQCAEGDMAACDSLYWDTQAGSDAEKFGSTCGDRTEATRGGCETEVATTRSTTPTTTPEPEPELTCWDGTTVTETAPCPQVTGIEGLRWVFPADPGFDECQPINDDIPSQHQARCTWDDSGGVAVFLNRWQSVAAGHDLLSEGLGTGREWKLSRSDTPVGTAWDAVQPSGHFSCARMYGDVPFSAEVVGADEAVVRDLCQQRMRFTFPEVIADRHIP